MYNKSLDKLEVQIIIGINIMSSLIIIYDYNLITLFIALELFGFSTIFLLLFNHNYNIRSITIIYFIFNSISSILFLFGIFIIYSTFGILNIYDLSIMNIFNNNNYNFIIFALLFKIGAVPFHILLIVLYNNINTLITLYQFILPKILYTFLLYNFIFLFNINILFIIILTLIIGSIIGLNINSIKGILTSSSIYNTGLIILCLFNIFLINENILSEFILLYFINTINIFTILLLFNNLNKLNDIVSLNNSYPFIKWLFLISILSFIGIPPLSGFYLKLYVIFNTLNNPLFLFIIFIFIITSLFTCIYYLSLIIPLFYNTNIITNNNIKFNYPINITYILSYSSLLIILLPFSYIINLLSLF